MSSLYQSMITVIEQTITPLAGRLGQQNMLSLSATVLPLHCRL